MRFSRLLISFLRCFVGVSTFPNSNEYNKLNGFLLFGDGQIVAKLVATVI